MAPGISLAPQVAARLAFSVSAGRSYLARQFTPHPFHITRPYHDPGDPAGMATLYLQSSSGGIYGGDDLGLSVTLDPGAQVHLTTQASTVVHDARGGPAARQEVRLEVGAGGWLEYCPDPAILMAGAALDNRVSATLAEGAVLILSDAQLCHDPAGAGRGFDRLDSELRIAGPEGARLIDRFDLRGTDWTARTGGYGCSGLTLVAGGAAQAGPAMIAALDARPDVYAGLSLLGDRDLAIVRFLTRDGVSLSHALRESWAAARRALSGRAPPPRRK
ncbi:urease accessory protein UreD [Salipiger sp. P9]|uniref:urease accessory protein UreD n=1 Tax=Salipiger pentaromativorans TaxID=2943193 RepID=UPI002157C532|nr:urease accessory protein UreD [Salipiger pentaromativorans]MCR8549271.1 urease accessory protein UreD [Salipiger pentaromativorans]